MSIFESTRYGGRTDKEEGLRLLRERGAAKAVLTFSGGGDEGGVDEITLFFPTVAKDGEPVTKDLHVYWEGQEVHRDWNKEGGGYTERPLTEEEKKDAELSVVLCGPVDDEYGSFAGEFTVEGTVTWDVAEGKVTMAKDEAVASWDSSEKEW